MAEINGAGQTTREINAALRRLVAQGETQLVVRHPGARHNLGVATVQPVQLTFVGSVGYYCVGMSDGPTVEIHGSAGWGLAESLLSGTVLVHGHAGNGAAASMRGGTVVIYGDAAARAGVAMKGGTLLIAGDCGYMAGFMGQKGTLIVCGDTGEAFADSMYATVCFVGGRIAELGNDAIMAELTAEDTAFLATTLAQYLNAPWPDPAGFKKVVAGRRLWNFDQRDWTIWREAL